MLPLLSELFHHFLVFLVPLRNFQDHWRSTERGRAAMFRTKVALFVTELNRWHFLAKETGIRHAALDSLASVAMGTELCGGTVGPDISSFSTSGNDAHIIVWLRARPRVTGALTIVVKRSCTTSSTKVVGLPILDVHGLGIAILAHA